MEQIQFKDNEKYIIMEHIGSIVFFDKDVKDLREKIKEIAESGKHLIMDFKKAEYIDSFYQGFLIYTNSVFTKAGKKLVLYNFNNYIRVTLRIAKIDAILTLAEDNIEALKLIGE